MMPKMTRAEVIEAVGEEDAMSPLAYFADAPELYVWSSEWPEEALEYDNLTSMVDDAEEILWTEDGGFAVFDFDGYRFGMLRIWGADAFFADKPLEAM